MHTAFSALSASAGIPLILLLAKATLILVMALGVTIAMQRSSAGARHLVWLVTIAALMLVPALTAWGPLSVRVLPATEALGESPLSVTPPVAESTLPTTTERTNIDPSTGAAQAASTGMVGRLAGLEPLSVLLMIWAAVMLAIVLSLGHAALAVRRIVRNAEPLDSPDWVGPMWDVADRLGLDDVPRLLRSEEAKMPFACGVFTPTIVLPSSADAWTLQRRHAVLLHELAHVKRHDLIGHTLGRFACAFYWFHPLVWTAAKQLRSESERACDDLALSSGARATDYAEHLLDIVTSVKRDATPAMALAMARRKEFEGRMLAILDPDLRHSVPGRVQTASLIGSLALISIVVGAAAPAPRAQTLSQRQPQQEAHQVAVGRSDKPVPPPYQAASSIAEATSAVAQPMPRPSVASVPAPAPEEKVGRHDDEDVPAPTEKSTGVVVNARSLINIISSSQSDRVSKAADERPVLLARILASDPSAELRRIAAWGLAEHAETMVAERALADALRRDSEATVREMAAWALSQGDDGSAAVEALSAAIRADASTSVRRTATWALGGIGSQSGVDALTAALSDPNAEIRTRAAWGLGNSEPRKAPAALVRLLGDSDPRVRKLAAWALFQIEDPATVPALDAALRTETVKELQVAYIRALASIGEESVDALRGLLESRDPQIKNVAVRALAGGNATGPWPWPWPQPRPFP